MALQALIEDPKSPGTLFAIFYTNGRTTPQENIPDQPDDPDALDAN